jgi:carboxyl-terminal processing protease
MFLSLLHKQSLRTRIILVVIVVALLIAGAFFLGVQMGERGLSAGIVPATVSNPALEPEGVDFSPVWLSWNVLNEKFVSASTTEKVSSQERVWGMIKGLADSFGDPYTVFFPPIESEIFESDISGNFEGVGMEIGIRNDVLTVVAPLKGTPAYNAGLLSGDQIIKIDGEDSYGLSVDKAVKKIRGERGTTVTFEVLREGEDKTLTIPVVRDVIQIPALSTDESDQAGLRPDGVYVIKLYNFSANSANLFREALRGFVLSGSDKLILDLRGNPGGYLEAAVDMASWFLPVGKAVVIEDFGQKAKPQYHRSKGYDVFNDTLKMAIVVNQGSASASEILAGALNEHGIATLVGERTFGKGSVQELVEITDDTSLKVTIARWLTPNGNSISNGGLTPDIEVSMTADDIKVGNDPQLERAADYLKSL